MNKKPLVIIAGPTAIGKTAISIKLAKQINGEIISADSMQVYRGMDIGTAKITEDEMDGVAHHLIDILDPRDDFNVVLFKDLAKEAIEQIYNNNHVPIIVGGTGFYIQSILYDIDFTSTTENSEFRNELWEIAATKGNEYLHSMLKQVDEKAAASIHANNVKRVIRAIEFNKETGLKISDHNEAQKQNESPYNYCYFVIDDDRDKIYDRIDKRVDMMIEAGLIDEVRGLKNQGLTTANISMLGLGYKEIYSYLLGEIDLEEAVRIIKRDTRHFAKKQATWFKREKDVVYIKKDTEEVMLKNMSDILNTKNII